MYAYLLRRILATIPVMLVVALFVFALLHLSPGDPLSSVGFSLRLLWAAVGRHGADRQQSRDCSATVLEVWSPPAGADPDRARPG